MKEETKILKPKKLKTLGLLLISILFVTAGFFIKDNKPFIAWSSILFFGLGIIVFLIQLLPNSSYLKLTSKGFEIRNLYKSHFTSWSDIESFTTGIIGTNKMVMFNYSKEHNKHSSGKKVARNLSGSEGGLPNTYGMKAEDLAKLLNDWKFKYS